jgi:adenosylmethionine-8-amino-7-oxononanoate aminotransferase
MIGMCSFRSEAGGGAHAKRVARKAMELGLFVRPLGPSLYLWPPLVSSEAELGQMLSLFETAVAETPALDEAVTTGNAG